MKKTNNNVTTRTEEKETARAQMDNSFYYFSDLDMCIVGYPSEEKARAAAEETFEENLLMGIDLRASLPEKTGAEAICNA